MGDSNHLALNRVLLFAAIVEVGTGVALLLVPAVVISLLMGAGASGLALPVARFLGIALLALGVACWPPRQQAERGTTVVPGMLLYNVLVAMFLAWLGLVAGIGGVLLWPGVALHAVVALLLAWNLKRTR